MNSLDFSMKANNDMEVPFTFIRKDGTRINLTDYVILWGMFLNGNEVLSKTSVGGIQIAILDQTVALNVGKGILYIDAADTKNFQTETEYVHEFVLTDPFDKSSNPTDTGAEGCKCPGTIYLCRQFKAQS